GKDAAEPGGREGQGERSLVEYLGAGMSGRHGAERRRAVEAHGVLPERPEVAEVAARSAAKIMDGKGRVAGHRIEQRRIILADIVIARARPEPLRLAVIVGDCRARRLAHEVDFVARRLFAL